VRKKSLSPLGETEMEILHHVWSLQRATVTEVKERIEQERPVAYTTVMTVLRNLADKGYLSFEKDGAQYVYSAQREPSEVKMSLLQDLLTKVFRGSPTALVQTLVANENLSDEERHHIRRLIEDMERP